METKPFSELSALMIYCIVEKDALLLAIKLGKVLFATDDGKAIKAARFFGVPFIITPKLVVELFKRQEISLKKARVSLEKLKSCSRKMDFNYKR